MNAISKNNVFPLPVAAGFAAPPPPEPPSSTATATAGTSRLVMTRAELASRLGIGDQCLGTQIMKLRTLAKFGGLPLPRGVRMWGKREVRGPRAIVKNATWDRWQVECWLEERDAPAERARTTRADRERLRADLASRAAEIASAGSAA